MFHARLSPHALQIHMTIMLKKVYRNTSNFLSLAILLAILFLRKIIFLLWKGVVFIYLVGYKYLFANQMSILVCKVYLLHH